MVGYKLSKNDWVTPFFVIFRSVREILLVTVFCKHPVLLILIKYSKWIFFVHNFFWLTKTWIRNFLIENPIFFWQFWRLLTICAMLGDLVDGGTSGFDLALAILQKGDQVRVMFNIWQSATNQNDLCSLKKTIPAPTLEFHVVCFSSMI